MIRSIKAHPAHLDLIIPKAIFSGEDYMSTMPAYMKLPNVFMHTLMLENEILGIVGLSLICKGVGETISLLSDSILKCGREFTEKVEEMHLFYAANLGLHRFHSYVKASDAKAVNWLESLRYKKEGLLCSMNADGEDYFVFGRTKKNGGIT